MMENKIPVFESLPDSELSKLTDEKNEDSTMDNLRGIEKEFSETNLHTKQTHKNDDNTDNIDNTVNTGKTQKRKTRLSSLMGEKGSSFAVELIDMLIPSIVVLIISYFGYSLEKKDLKLNKDEKEALTPALMDVLDEINLNFDNVWVNLGIMLSIVYGTKIADKLPTLKKKVPEIMVEKTGMTESINKVMAESNTNNNDELSDMGKFEIDYGKLVDEIRLSRKRGVGDAKEYLANNYPEKIKTIAKKNNIPLHLIDDKLDFQWTPKKRKAKDAANDFELE